MKAFVCYPPIGGRRSPEECVRRYGRFAALHGSGEEFMVIAETTPATTTSNLQQGMIPLERVHTVVDGTPSVSTLGET